jgi:nucleotide-binding universal stress UspA family protein
MKRFQNILYVVSGEGSLGHSLERAVSLAKTNGARLTVLQVLPEVLNNIGKMHIELLGEAYPEDITQQRKKVLNEILSERFADQEIRVEVCIGTAFLSIIAKVLQCQFDLVIKVVEHDILTQVFGSDDAHLLRKCPCPVWLIKPELPQQCRRIMVAVDVDDTFDATELKVRKALNCQLMEMALSVAINEFAQLKVVNVIADFDLKVLKEYTGIEELQIKQYVDQAKERHQEGMARLIRQVTASVGSTELEYVEPTQHLLVGAPAAEIVEFANQNNVDLVIMGTVARTGIAGFFIGNTAEKILSGINCSVLTIKPKGFETPVQV